MIAGLVGSAISWVFDMAKDKGEDLVTEGIKKVTGIDLKASKTLTQAQIETINKYKLEIENLDFKKLKLELKDRANARKMNIDIQDSKDWLVRNTGSMLAIFTILSAFILDILLIVMIVNGTEINPIYTLIQGAMNARAIQVLSFYFGDSKTNSDSKRSI